jgi:hypothetical protein
MSKRRNFSGDPENWKGRNEMTTNNPKTLGQIALDAAVKSVGNVDSACYDATVSLSLVLASKQFERMEQGESMDSESSIAANKGVWRIVPRGVV